MAFCSLSKELTAVSHTQIENVFLFEYMPELGGDTVKVYLYGLYLCQSAPKDYSVKDMAKTLKMEEAALMHAFFVLEEAGLVEVLSEDPAEIRYLPLSSAPRTRTFKAEKYTEFTRALQSLLPDRMISVTEYRAYFSLMENRNIKPEALLMIVRYCTDKKGAGITYRYIETVANDFADRGILTADAVEGELADYFGRSGEIDAVLKKLGQKRKAEVADLKFYEKWTDKLGFTPETVLLAASHIKRGDLAQLDRLLADLYAAKAFSKKEIADYFEKREELCDTAKEICRCLSVYAEVTDPVVSDYCAPWAAMGYDRKSLVFLAKYNFRKNRKTLEALDELIRKLYEKGIVSLSAIVAHIEEIRATEQAVAAVLSAAGVDRRVTDWDRQTYSVWKDQWNFSDEMILYAARLSAGKSGPIAYMNAVLSSFKTENCFTVEEAEKRRPRAAIKSAPAFSQRDYTEEELSEIVAGDDDPLL